MSLTATGISVRYRDGAHVRTVLDGATLSVDSDSLALMGPSGSGKSTLLRILAGMQAPDAGQVVLGGRAVDVSADSGGAADERFGFVYQDYKLVDFLTVRENVALTAELRRVELPSGALDDVLEAVGLGGMARRRPFSLSGGEQQRVAIARALVSKPKVLLADEPTGSLDRETGAQVTHVLLRVTRQLNCILIVATHDHQVATQLSRRATLTMGKLEVSDQLAC